MQFKHYSLITLVVFFATLIFVSGTGFTADDDPVTIAGILSAADCPLTEAQAKTLSDIEPGEGMRDLFMGLQDLFTDDQDKALRSELGETPARGNRPARIRNLFQIIILEKEGIPMTEGQVEAINDIEPGQGNREAMQEIFTAEQGEAMQKYMGDRGMGRGPRGGR